MKLSLHKTLNPVPYSVRTITGKPLCKGLVQHVTSPVRLEVGLLHKEEI